MQVTPSGERPFSTPPTPNAPDLESARFANRDTVVLPDEMVIRILMYLGTTDIAVCRRVNRYWQTLIDTRHLLARSFYRDCHLTQQTNSLAAQRNLAVERYQSHIRDWLAGFSDRGGETAEQLDNILEDRYFPQMLFFSIPKLLLNSKELNYQNIATIRHLGVVRDACFSPDGKYLVIVSDHKAAKLLELEGGQWREKAILMYSLWVKSASFSPDGNHLVTASGGICKLWRLKDDQWQEGDTIQHSVRTTNASFSPDGKHLVTLVPYSDSAKIWWLEDGRWQKKASIEHSGQQVANAQFSPDGKHLVTTTVDGIVKIWKLDDGQWGEKFTIDHLNGVKIAGLSPDGKHLATVTSGMTFGNIIVHVKLLELVDGKWQENATIVHCGIVSDSHFSLDGKHLVTASYDGTAKICGLEGGKWQVKATVWHLGPVANASFSRDGKFLVTASRDSTAKICRLVGGKWRGIVTIGHSKAVTHASFGPDCQLVTACRDNTVKIWVLKNKENNDNS